MKSSFKRLAILLVGALAIAANASAAAQHVDLPAKSGPVGFDIPAQPLGDALFSYTAKAGIEVFVDDALVRGRMSTPLHGVYAPDAALRTLLSGTGLQIRRAARNAFTIIASNVPLPSLGWRPSWSADDVRLRFYAALQGAVRNAICRRAAIEPGPYRAALAVWINATGTIRDVRLLTVDMDQAIGRELLVRLRGVSIGAARPESIAQPIVFVVLPRSQDDAHDCMSAASAGK